MGQPTSTEQETSTIDSFSKEDFEATNSSEFNFDTDNSSKSKKNLGRVIG